MDFAIPADLQAYLDELDAFIEAEIKPLEEQDDNIRFFDHRREHAQPEGQDRTLQGCHGGALAVVARQASASHASRAFLHR